MIKAVEAAKELGCSYNGIMAWIRSGKIQAVKIGRFWKINTTEIERIKREGLSLKKTMPKEAKKANEEV